MKYFPLVWAALTRKPARAILTLLAMTVAFTLVGLMIGMSASFDRIAAMTRAGQRALVPFEPLDYAHAVLEALAERAAAARHGSGS